jgi:pimeloyl-ACP methyl ester carboxylesterase
MEERRKPILGRVVPGVTPTLQRRLRRIFAMLQWLSVPLASKAAFRLFLTPPRRKVEPADAPIIAQADRATLRCGSDKFTVWHWGQGQPTVVLLHGWGSHAARFATFVAPLRAAGYSVIGIDAPAHGTSPGTLSDLPRFRDSLAEVLRRHAPVHAVIGHSLGGGAVLTVLAETAEYHPKKICLFGVPSDMDYILGSFAMMLGLKYVTRAHLRERFAKRFGRPAASISVAAAAAHVRIPCSSSTTRRTTSHPFDQGTALAAAIPHAILWRTQGLGHSGALRDSGDHRSRGEFSRRVKP